MEIYHKYSGSNQKIELQLMPDGTNILPHAVTSGLEVKLFQKYYHKPTLIFGRDAFIEKDVDTLILPIEADAIDSLPSGPIVLQVTYSIPDADFEDGDEINRELGILFNLIEGV